MPIYSFGSGVLMGRRSDVANSTPVNFGLVQEVSIETTFNIKELYGQYQFPVAIARGTAKVQGKAKVAQISGLAFNNLFFAQSASAAQVSLAYNETGSIPANPGPYTITVANAANFVADFGVLNALTGVPYTKVAAAPTTGQYSVNETTGVYTFAAADETLGVLISYTYNISSGLKFTLANQLLGTTPYFQAQFREVFDGKTINVTFNKCISSKLAFATKLEDFTMPDFEFGAQADAAQNVITWSFSESS